MPNDQSYSITDHEVGLDENLQRPEIEPLKMGGSALLPNYISQPTLAGSIESGEMPSLIGFNKKKFSDTLPGWLQGLDVDNKFKWFIGDSVSSADWNVTAPDTFTIKGTISATTGNIGGFVIGPDYIRDVANSFGLASTVTAGDDVRFWAGATFANRATATFRLTEAGNLTVTGGIITAGRMRTSAGAPRVELSGANNRLDIYDGSGNNVGYFGRDGGNGNFMFIFQVDTNQDFPPMYVDCAQDSNVFNLLNSNNTITNRPAVKFETNNPNSECLYVKQTNNRMAAVIETNSSNYAALYVVQLGTYDLISTSVAGCYCSAAGVWTDASSKTLKENFEDIEICEKLKTLEIKKYNYLSERKKNMDEIRDMIIEQKKREKFGKRDEIRKGSSLASNDRRFMEEILSEEELLDIDQKVEEESAREQNRVVEKHFTPMAEEFHQLFGLGNEKGISPNDTAGIALQGVKELIKRVEDLELKLSKIV